MADNSKPKNPFSREDFKRIQKATVQRFGGKTPKGSFAAMVQSKVDKAESRP